MHELLTKLLQANLAATAAILAVLLLRKGVRTAFGARIAYALWLLVPLAGAASLAPPRPAAFLPAAPAPLAKAAEETAAQPWTWGADTAAPTGLDPTPIAFGLWLAGLLAMIALLAMRQSQFMLLHRLGEAGPAVIGFLRPRIITPSDFEERFDRRERTVVLAHEKIHLARHDARINAAVALTRCVCWFNPLVHVAAHLMRVDQELACDAAVVARHPKARAPYAQALLKAQLAARPLPLGCYWPAGTEHPLTERIAMLKRSDPSSLRRVSGAVLIALLSAAASYAAWAAAPAAEAPLAYVEEAFMPEPELAPIQAPAAAANRPAPAAAKAGEQTAPATPTDVCLTNACAEPAPAAPVRPPLPFERVLYVGAAQLPAREPFAKYFDAEAPVLIKGKVSGVRMTDGMASDLMVQGDDGKLYRVQGGDPATLTPEVRAMFQDMVGAGVTVRGYLAYDTSCEGGCLTNGRNVTFTDGNPVLAPRSVTPAKP